MRKHSEVSANRRSKVSKDVEASVRAHWNQVATNQSDEELQKCLGTFPLYSASGDSVECAHKFTTKDWTQGHAWRLNRSKQIRHVPQSGVYVAVAPGVQGHLTDKRAFSDGSWSTFDDFTEMCYNISMLTEDNTRPEMYCCT
jgi:hypothetical protein